MSSQIEKHRAKIEKHGAKIVQLEGKQFLLEVERLKPKMREISRLMSAVKPILTKVVKAGFDPEIAIAEIQLKDPSSTALFATHSKKHPFGQLEAYGDHLTKRAAAVLYRPWQPGDWFLLEGHVVNRVPWDKLEGMLRSKRAFLPVKKMLSNIQISHFDDLSESLMWMRHRAEEEAAKGL